MYLTSIVGSDLGQTWLGDWPGLPEGSPSSRRRYFVTRWGRMVR